MKAKTINLLFCVVGTILPSGQFLHRLAEHGLDGQLFLQHLLANRISTFFVLDVVVSALVLLRFAAVESSRLGLRSRWLVLPATLLVGVSLGLPLFLYLREKCLEQRTPLVQV